MPIVPFFNPDTGASGGAGGGGGGGGGSTPGWDSTYIGLTGLDVATLPNGATTSVTRAAVPILSVKVVNYNSNNGVVSAGAAGIAIAGGSANGSLSIGFDLAALFVLTLPADVLNDVAVSLHLDSLGDWTGGTDGWEAGIMADSSANFSTGTGFSARGDFDAVGQDRLVSTNNSTSSWVANEAVPSGPWTVTMLLRGAQIAEAFYALSAGQPTEATLNAGGRVLARTIASGSARWADSALWASARVIWRPNITLTGITLQTRRIA